MPSTRDGSWDAPIEDSEELFRTCRLQWGTEAQLTKLAEEAAELAAVASRELNGQADEGDLLREMVDVRVMIEQFALLFTDDSLEEETAAALDDLETRLTEAADAE